MLDEELNVRSSRPSLKPPDIGLTLVIKSINCTSDELLDKVISVWSVVASWGRTEDEELGEWPSNEECFAQLPAWFQTVLSTNVNVSLDSWLDTLDEREWVWWSGTVTKDWVKADINAEAMPISIWPLTFLFESAGGIVIYYGQWLDEASISARLSG